MTTLTQQDYLPEQDVWEEGVYMLKETDPVLGGIAGIDNLPLKHLANRTRYLKKQVEIGEKKRELAFKELTKPDGYKFIGRCKSIDELRTIRPTEHGQRILVDAYHSGGTTGGGEFIADLQDMSTPDDGGVCIINNNNTRWKRVYDKLSISDFGADPKAIANNNAFIDMANSVGYIRVPVGIYKLSTLTIMSPIYFDVGAAITGDSGQKITISSRIHASPQYIFRGDATYKFEHTQSQGEDSRQAHVAWFGAQVVAGSNIEQSDYIQKALDAFGNAREGELIFDVGNYYVTKPMFVPRCVKIKGAGQRRTVFKVGRDGFDVFTTREQGCRFEDIQFEIRGYDVRKQGYYINIQHDKCDIIDVSCGEAVHNIGVFGHNCRINKIMAVFGHQIDGGSIIDVQASNCKINDVQSLSGFSPSSIINIGGNVAANISGADVDGVFSVGHGALVTFDASTSSITRSSAKGLKHNGYSSLKPEYAVRVHTSDAYGIDGIILDDILISSHALNGMLFEQRGTGQIKNVSLTNIIIQGSSGIGIKFDESKHKSITGILLSDTVNVQERAMPIVIAGKPSLNIAPTVDVNTNNCIAYDLSLNNNTASIINFRRHIYTGMLFMTAGSVAHGQFIIRAAPSPSLISITKSDNVRAVVGDLSGTTGSAGSITLGVQDGMLSVENQTGATQRVTIGLITGVAV